MKRVLKRLTGAPVGPIPPGAWLAAAAGAVIVLGWAVLREPVSVVVGTATAPDSGVGDGFDVGQFAPQELTPGGLLLTGVPPDGTRHLFELDELALRLRLRALTGGGDGVCSDPAAAGAPPPAAGDSVADGAGLQASPRLTGWLGGGDVGADACRPEPRTPSGAGDGGP